MRAKIRFWRRLRPVISVEALSMKIESNPTDSS